MPDPLARIVEKKAELDRLRPLAPHGLGNLEHVHDLELTYTPNAIEGNTLTAAETTLVVEHGLTIGGKPPVSVRPQDRPAYIAALQAAQSGAGTDDFERLLHERLDATLDEYIAALKTALPKS